MSYLENIDVQLVEFLPIYIPSIRKMVSADECAKGYGQFFTQLYEKIAAADCTMSGPRRETMN